MLVYPVISAEWHAKTYENLWCTDTPSEEQLAATSLEKHVDADSAPMFLVHTANDPVVNVGNTLVMARACAEAGIPIAVTALSDKAKDLRSAPLERMAVVIGSEGRGVRREILDAADVELIIPMNPHCESLNAAIAAAIVMRQMKK